MANKKKRSRKPEEIRPHSQSQDSQRAPQQGRQPSRRVSRKTLVGIVAGIAVVVAAILVLVGLFGRPTPPPATSGASFIKGSPDAKVTVEEFSDFQCSYCADFALRTLPSIDKNYIETGKVRWVFRNMALIGEESKQAAQAAQCAGEQGQFWPYHDKVFASQQGKNRGAFSSDKLKSFARGLGLDVEAFSSCLDSGRYSDLVDRDLAEGEQRGVRGTPTFFIDGQALVGALPYSNFQQALDKALSAKQ